MVNGWIRFADAKAGALLAGGGGISALLLHGFSNPASGIRNVSAWSLGLFIAALVAAVGVVVTALLCLAPLVHPSDTEWESRLFFRHIARHPSSVEFVASVREMTDQDLERDLAHQVRENSEIAEYKYDMVLRSMQFATAVVVLGATGWVTRIVGTI